MNIITGKSSQLPQRLYQEILVYRKKVFVDKLGWELNIQNGMELDQFDRPDTLYVVSENNNRQINGCARLLPTNHPYLLGEVFPQLMNGLPVPRSSDIWELSRFAALDFNTAKVKAQIQINSQLVSKLLYKSIECVAQHGGHRIITVSPIGIERMLSRFDVNVHRAGPPIIINHQPVVACWIEVD